MNRIQQACDRLIKSFFQSRLRHMGVTKEDACAVCAITDKPLWLVRSGKDLRQRIPQCGFSAEELKQIEFTFEAWDENGLPTMHSWRKYHGYDGDAFGGLCDVFNLFEKWEPEQFCRKALLLTPTTVTVLTEPELVEAI